MYAKLICYTLGKANYQIRGKFKREFSGYKDKSNMGQYTYERKGVLSGIPHSKPIRSVVIVEKIYENKIVQFLRKYKAKIKTYDVLIDKDELKIPQGLTP